MSHRALSLSYSARREVLAHVAPRYQKATDAQKTLLLDQIVELTGYERKYAIRLLNHDPKGAARILRPRQPIYGSMVQEALFLAWRTIQYPCAKRLVPCLPELIPVLERDGHLRLDEHHRRQLLTMSVRTAERLLSTQRRPSPRGISTTQPGTLLKHQIPIRTFAQWDDHRPGFLEADLVAHCGGNVFGGYLYTLTLTDIATGWTECLPVLNRSPETVLAAIKHARQLLPFPMLGLDTDNGGEFLNSALLAYCQQEQITFTCSRPECSNDNAHVEQKNGAVVRKIVGDDRLVSMLAYQQLGELYQAARLLVNCFQPSMKLQSKSIEGEYKCRMYDEAKTPLQRVLLSGELPRQLLELQESVESLDPLRLVQHLEALQRAVWRCAEGGPGTTLVCFSLDACVSAVARPGTGILDRSPGQKERLLHCWAINGQTRTQDMGGALREMIQQRNDVFTSIARQFHTAIQQQHFLGSCCLLVTRSDLGQHFPASAVTQRRFLMAHHGFSSVLWESRVPRVAEEHR